MKKVIVTGANGQLGQEIQQLTDKQDLLKFFFTDIDTLDLTKKADIEIYISSIEPDIVINCAAYTAVDKAESEIELATLINAEVPGYLAELSKSFEFKLIHISTDYVFSGEFSTPITENDITEPKSSYGKTKLKGEELVASKTDAVIVRTSWLYSVFGNNFVKSMIRLGKEKDELGVVFDQIGSPTNACDLADAIINITNQYANNNSWHPGTYHFSNEGVCSWYDFAIEIMEQAGLKCSVNPILTHQYPSPAPRPAFSVLDKQKIKNTYSIKIPYWKHSLTKAINKLK